MNDPQHPPELDDDQPERPSKTQRKKASHDLQKLGLELAALSEERLQALPIDETLREALLQAKTIRSHEGRRRHMQWVGKLMRKADPTPLIEAVSEAKTGPAQASLHLHESERWRSELLAHDDALTAWVAEYPQTDVQALRALIRSARKDASASVEQRSGKAFRELFQFIKAHRQANSNRPEDDHDE